MPAKPTDPRAGIAPPDERAVARKVRVRRVKRQLKAALSLVIAAAAGTFIACKSGGDEHRPDPPPNPTTDEVSNLPAPPRVADAGVDAAPADAGAPIDAGTALVPRDASKDASVDRREHRKGMPVPDNLLE